MAASILTGLASTALPHHTLKKSQVQISILPELRILSIFTSTRAANSFHAAFSLCQPHTHSFPNSSPSVKLRLYLNDNFLSSLSAKLSVFL